MTHDDCVICYHIEKFRVDNTHTHSRELSKTDFKNWKIAFRYHQTTIESITTLIESLVSVIHIYDFFLFLGIRQTGYVCGFWSSFSYFIRLLLVPALFLFLLYFSFCFFCVWLNRSKSNVDFVNGNFQKHSVTCGSNEISTYTVPWASLWID